MLVFLCLCGGSLRAAELRPAAVPLVAVDPYFSIWSAADRLTDKETEHWTGRPHPLHLMVRIDGNPYRLMGAEPASVPTMRQKSLQVGPLTTKYVFENETAEITLKFLTPFLPDDLELFSRPTVYLLLEYRSKGAQKRDLEFYFDAGAEIVVDNTNQRIAVSEAQTVFDDMIQTISFGSVDQNVLGKRGDDVRIDWGHFTLSTLKISAEDGDENLVPLIDLSARNRETAQKEFAKTGMLQTELQPQENYRLDETPVSLVAVWKIKDVKKIDIFPIALTYDDTLSIRYFGEDLPAYWRKDGKTTEELVSDCWETLNELDFHDKVREFEETFFDDLTAVGGEDYAKLCALAYRQAFAAQKIVADSNGMPLMFSKENNSNGSIGTVDLMYPCSPLLLYYSPAMQKATMQPIFDYSNTEKWKFPFAPHDVGTYPHATGQTYGGAERSEENQMPVEESANMIIQVAALAVAEGNADYAAMHWDTLSRWADYLLEKGFDPENQLCTDDFAGHLAHNVNLSAKAIVAIAAYAQLAEKLGKTDAAKKYRTKAEEFAARWIKEADDGDHFRLAFDRKGTWSIKYNLMWDQILDLKLFPGEVMEKEIRYYKTVMQKYGLPLDNRSLYSKGDWILWTATMCKNPEDFHAFVQPVVDYVNNTTDRVPLSDWYFTDSARQRGFKARSVVGGFWAPMLKDTEKWKAQAAKGANVHGQWAPIVLPGKPVGILAENAENGKITWKYTMEKPAEGWEKADFDDSSWKSGIGGFGTRDTPGVIVGTTWNTKNIWIRRSFEWDGNIPENAVPALSLHHDDDVQIHLNGALIFSRDGYTSSYETLLVPKLSEHLKKGKNTFSVHCFQGHGGQYIDVGILWMEKKKK